MSAIPATWAKGKRRVSGTWEYYRASGFFAIRLNKRCSISGQPIVFKVWGDEPEWNGWVCVSDSQGQSTPSSEQGE